MNKYEVRFAGFGGQGIVLAGIILAKTASLEEGKNAVQTQLYGPESRGGASRCEVVISEEKIDYPKVDNADLLVLMSQEAADRYCSEIKDNAIIIYDADLVKINKMQNARYYPIQATKIAEGLGYKIAANMVMLGAISAITGLISYPSLIKVIKKNTPKHAIEININATKEGFNTFTNVGSEVYEDCR